MTWQKAEVNGLFKLFGKGKCIECGKPVLAENERDVDEREF
jgi:hypothetical protein